MAESTQITCDRCGKFTVNDRSYWGQLTNQTTTKTWDLCPSCWEVFKDRFILRQDIVG